MCWSINIALAAAICHIITGVLVINSTSRYKVQYLLFLAFYCIMELFQTMQHLTISDDSCDIWNSFTTVIAYILIWAQPRLFYLIYRSTIGYSAVLNRMTIIVFIYALFSLLAGFFSVPTYRVPNSNFGHTTCTIHDANGHLQWFFAVKTIQYQPTHFVYLLLIGVISWDFPKELFRSITIGWWATLVISLLWIGLNPSLPSVWCVTSVFVNIPILYSINEEQYVTRYNNI